MHILTLPAAVACQDRGVGLGAVLAPLRCLSRKCTLHCTALHQCSMTWSIALHSRQPGRYFWRLSQERAGERVLVDELGMEMVHAHLLHVSDVWQLCDWPDSIQASKHANGNPCYKGRCQVRSMSSACDALQRCAAEFRHEIFRRHLRSTCDICMQSGQGRILQCLCTPMDALVCRDGFCMLCNLKLFCMATLSKAGLGNRKLGLT